MKKGMKGRRSELHVLTGQESAAHTSVINEQKGLQDNSLSVVKTQTEETSDSISNVQKELNLHTLALVYTPTHAKFIPRG